jgi:ribosomal protein L11 methyltransferase
MSTLTALVMTVPASERELAGDVLWGLGVAAIEERDPLGAGTEDHLVELWTSLGTEVESITRALEGLPRRWRWRLVEVDERVVHTWREYAHPVWISADLVVVPAWYQGDLGPHVSNAIRLDIDPGEAFGMGDHPTTIASLRALRAAMRPGATVVDVGCGSGILAVAAARFGAARVSAIDIAQAAVAATVDNARRNDVSERLEVSTTPLAEISGCFDIVVANILAPVIRELAPDLRRVLEPDGVLIVSGLLRDRTSEVVEALAPLRVIETDRCEGWAAITLRW